MEKEKNCMHYNKDLEEFFGVSLKEIFEKIDVMLRESFVYTSEETTFSGLKYLLRGKEIIEQAYVEAGLPMPDFENLIFDEFCELFPETAVSFGRAIFEYRFLDSLGWMTMRMIWYEGENLRSLVGGDFVHMSASTIGAIWGGRERLVAEFEQLNYYVELLDGAKFRDVYRLFPKIAANLGLALREIRSMIFDINMRRASQIGKKMSY